MIAGHPPRWEETAKVLGAYDKLLAFKAIELYPGNESAGAIRSLVESGGSGGSGGSDLHGRDAEYYKVLVQRRKTGMMLGGIRTLFGPSFAETGGSK